MNIVFFGVMLVGLAIFAFGYVLEENIYHGLNRGKQKCDLASDCRYCFQITAKDMRMQKGCQRKLCPAFVQSLGLILAFVAFFVAVAEFLSTFCCF